MHVPTLDHELFLRGNSKQRSEYAGQLVASFKSHGFVKINNHGIDESTIDELFQRVCLTFSISSFLGMCSFACFRRKTFSNFHHMSNMVLSINLVIIHNVDGVALGKSRRLTFMDVLQIAPTVS
jgi:hypothetical protein